MAATAQISESSHAEEFYFQKQVQAQTRMIVVLENGEQIEGCIEWYDRNSIKVRGSSRMLIYKSAIKYIYKAGEKHV
jgi:RNA chaperone Hfq